MKRGVAFGPIRKVSAAAPPKHAKLVDPDDPDYDENQGAVVVDDDEAIAAFFQEVKQEQKSTHVIRKVGGFQDLDIIRVGPEFVDENYYECTPVPLWPKAQPVINYDSFLEKTDEEIIVITPIKPQTFSALFQFYRDRSPALNWDPQLTDLEEDCFYQTLIKWPSKKLTHSLPHESKKENVPKKRVKVYKPSGDYIYKTRLTIDLDETPTVMLFEIKGILVLETDAETFAAVKANNERYQEILKEHEVSDTYVPDYAQSFDDYSLTKCTDCKISGCQDRGTQVHTYFIFDEYIKVAEEDAKRKIIEQDEATAKALAEKARMDIPQGGWTDSDSDDSDEEIQAQHDMDFRADISKYKYDDEDIHRAMILSEASDDDVAMTDGDEEEFEIRQSLDTYYKNRQLIESKRPPRNYPDISFSLIAMERIICMDSQQLRQADMRGLIEPEPVKSTFAITPHSDDEDATKAEEDLDEDAMVSLLIEQHRMQEQLEQDNSVDQGPTLIIPEDGFIGKTGDNKGEDEDDDDDLLQEANAMEEAERKRQEQLKAEQDAATALEAQQAMESGEEEKDEFDLAMEELKVAATSSQVAELIASQAPAASEPTETAGPEAGTAVTGAELSSMMDQDTTNNKEDIDPGTGDQTTTGPPDSKQATTEVKTIMAPQRQTVSSPSSTPSQMINAEETGGGAELKCAWNESDEKLDEEQEIEANLAGGVHDVIDDIPLDLPQYNPEDQLSDEESESAIKARKKKNLETAKMVEDQKASGDAIASGVQQILSDKEKRLSGEGEEVIVEEKIPPPEEDEFDDISSEETHHENSEFSDHWELSEDASTDSNVSEKKGRKTLEYHNPAKLYTSDWVKDPMDDNLAPMTQGPHLRQYWTFKCRETMGMEVTDITLHPLNENIIAASYGSVRFGDHEKEGLVCVWNAKNNQSPERTYKLRAPGTSLAFSELTPFVLAVGMLDGNVVLFDLREDDATILGSTVGQKFSYGHTGPIWQVYFLIQADPSNEEVLDENLLTLGDDGLLKKWTITKGLESTVLMKVGRSTMQVPGRREKRSESLITSLSIAYTVCFFPSNSDLFLLGTDEGFIHKCSTAYKESYLNTYVGHTGPIYRVAFSQFDDTIFFSCGGDWTVKMWIMDQPAPLLSMQTGHRTIFDVCCSFFISTVFICTTEYHIEVWDLSVNTLEPVVHYKPPFAVGQRKVTFIGLLNSVIIGDDEGSLTIYGIRNFPKTAAGSKYLQRELLLESLVPGYKRRKESEALERLEREQNRNSIASE